MAIPLGTDWIDRTPNPAYQFQILNNVATPQSVWAANSASIAIATYAQAMLFDDHKITATMKTPGGDDVALFYLRGNNSTQVVLEAFMGGAWVISTCNGPYSALLESYTIQYQGQEVINWADGDVISFEARGNVYNAYKNGVLLFAWLDDEGVYDQNIDATHRECSIGYVWRSFTTGGFDQVSVDDLFVWPSTVGNIGNGALSAPTPFAVYTPGRTLLEDFTRANSTVSPGPEWLNRNGVAGVISNAMYPVTPSLWCQASWGVLSNNDCEVTVTLGPYVGTPGGDYSWGMLGCNIAGECVALHTNGSIYAIYTQDTWAMGGIVLQAQVNGSVATGDKFTLRRIGNVYTAYKNGVYTGLTWTDAAPVIPINQAHRGVGAACYGDGTNYRTIGDFEAKDLNPPTCKLGIGNGILSATQTFAPNGPSTDTKSVAGAYTSSIPWWANKIDVIIIGGGAGGSGGQNFGSNDGNGGNASAWSSTTLTRGVDIPWSTTSITGTVGAAGTAGGSNGGASGAGGTTNAAATGWAAGLSRAGGAAVSGTGGTNAGGSPGNVTVQGVLYTGGTGGSGGTSPGGTGTAPGAGGGGGNNNTIGTGQSGGPGAIGRAIFRYWQ